MEICDLQGQPYEIVLIFTNSSSNPIGDVGNYTDADGEDDDTDEDNNMSYQYLIHWSQHNSPMHLISFSNTKWYNYDRSETLWGWSSAYEEGTHETSMRVNVCHTEI